MTYTEYRDILESIPGIVFVFDSTGKLSYTNSQATTLLGYPDEELKKMNVLDFLITRDQERAARGLSNIFIGKTYQSVVYTFKKNDGSTSPFHIYIKQMYQDNRISKAIGLAVDINEITEAEAKLLKVKEEHQQFVNMAVLSSVYDSLTGLLNKDTFLARVQVQILKATKRHSKNGVFALLCLSIDRFKNINNIHGPKAGDYILTEVARKMQIVFRKDDVLARANGNKFYSLLLDVDKMDNLSLVMTKLFDEFTHPITFENKSINIEVSVGITIYPDDDSDEIMLVKHSEEAMYNARMKKNNSYQLFDKTMHLELLNRISIDYELKQAISNDELFPLFQPKFDQSKTIIGVEALIRWDSPSRGIVPPCVFIPIAEDNGLIFEIGNIMLRKSCEEVKRWHNAGVNKITVAVNLSPYQFNHNQLINEIVSIINNSGIENKYIELEITESGIIMNETETISKLENLHDKGISIAIDDFGTGYSSLSKLQNYPIDTLKIDKSFIDYIPYNKKSATLTKTIIDLAHNLGYSVVAEGVENEEQFNFLLNNNCDHFQGYYFEKPVNGNKILELLTEEANNQ